MELSAGRLPREFDSAAELSPVAQRMAGWPTPKGSASHYGQPRDQDRGDLQAAVLWPTPTVKGDYNKHGLSAKSGDGLATAVLWPTPTAGNFNDGEDPEGWAARQAALRAKGVNGNGMGTPLGMAVQLWPTPIARDHRSIHGPADPGNARPLSEVVGLWATPTAVDGTGGPGQGARAEGTPNLRTQVPAWATPHAADGNGGGGSRGGDRGRRRNLKDQAGGASLNPAWVELLMGLPAGWTATSGEQAAWPGWPGPPGAPQHPFEPPRTVTGRSVADRTRRLSALGNAVVPQQALAAITALAAAERIAFEPAG